MKIIAISLGLTLISGIAWAGEAVIPIETIVLEAANQSLEGQIAVGEVIRNRANKASRTFESVCLAPWQFSAWNDRQEARKRLSVVTGETYQKASRAWALSETSNLTNGARHYHALEVSPKWARGKKGQRIGDHLFYRGIA